MASAVKPAEKSLTNSFKKRLREMFHSSPALDTPVNIKKNVSWADSHNEQKHERLCKRSTPYPSMSKKMDADVSAALTLTFSESESDDDENVFNDSSFLTNDDISRIENGQKEKPIDSQSKWLVVEQEIKPDKYNSNNWNEKDLLLSPEEESSVSQDSSTDQNTSNEDVSALNGDDEDFEESDTSENEDESFDPNRSLAKQIIKRIQKLPPDNSPDSSDEYSDSVESVYEDSDEISASEELPKNNASDQNILNDYSSDEFNPGGVNTHRRILILDDSSSDDFTPPKLEQIIVDHNKKLPVLYDSSSNESSNEITNEFNFDQLFNPNLVKIDQCLVVEPGKVISNNNSDTTPSSFSLSYPDNKSPNKITNKRKRIKRANKNKEKTLNHEELEFEVTNTKSEKKLNSRSKKKFKPSSLKQPNHSEANTASPKSIEKNKEKILHHEELEFEVTNTKSEKKMNSRSKKKFKASSLKQSNQSEANTASPKSIEKSSSLVNGDDNLKGATRFPFKDSDNIVLETTDNSFNDVNQNDSLASEINMYDIRNIVRYHIAPNYCILLLKHPIKLYFHGKLSMTVLSGACEVLGHLLNFELKKEIDIYSPRGNCFLCFETLPFQSNSNINAALKEYNMTDQQIENLCTDLPENYCIIAVKNIKNNMLTYLEKHVAQVLFPIIQNAYDSKRPLAELEYRLQCLFEIETRWWKVYNIHEDWAPLVDDLLLKTKEQNSRALLCGGKSVGKSVLMRYMINKMLNEVDKVVCIDLDPGQHEFSPPGCLSVTVVDSPVFGPNYSHLRTPDKCFFVGDVNIAQCLDRYVSSVKALMKYCDDNISKDLPWVINYMGFTRSLGTDLIISIIKLVAPSLVVQIESEYVNRNYASLLDQKYIQNYKSTVPIDTPNIKLNYNLIVLSSVADYKVAGEWEYEPRQIREMCILAYFSQMLEGNTEITACTPYAVKLSSVTLHHANYAKQNSPAVLNGNFVALCTIDDQEKLDRSTVVSCCGFGIVRGIDPDNNELYLLTPTEESRLESVNCLYMGNVNIPPSVYMSAGHEGLVPYISMGVPKGISLIPKRNFRFIKSLLKK